MNKKIQYLMIFLLLTFSFFYTDKITNLLIEKSDLMKNINEISKKYNIEYENATINDNYIIPGLNGKYVNKINSYYEFKSLGYIDDAKLVFDEITPTVSVVNNSDKIIKRGNSKKKSVSLLVNNNELMKYCEDNDIKCTALLKYEIERYPSLEIINISNTSYNSLEDDLIKNKKDSNYCIVDFIPNCNKKYKVESSYEINNITLYTFNPSSGDIILIDDGTDINTFKYIIKTIKFRNLDIIYLSRLLSEELIYHK